jgi:uncharacterized low-complexity protein
MPEKKVLASTICTLSALSFSLGALAAQPGTDNLFEAESLDRGFMSHQLDIGEGKCGEGKCGEKDDKDDKDEEGACGEGSCGEEDKKDEEGKCGEGTCGEA